MSSDPSKPDEPQVGEPFAGESPEPGGTPDLASGSEATGAPAEDSAEGREAEGAGGEGAGGETEDVLDEQDVPDTQNPYEDADEDAAPVESLVGDEAEAEELDFRWYILKVQVNREESIRDALLRRVRMHGLEDMFGEIVVPTEDVAEYNKSGKRRIVKKKLYPGYIMVNMAIDDDSWFLVRETPGIGDFTGSAGRPTPMEAGEVERIISRGKAAEGDEGQVKTSIPFKSGDQVRVKDGNFQGFEGEVESIDEAHGRVTVMINIFGRPTPVELEHWQVESV